ncbi:DEAD/DEAH box helicase [Oceanobacillus sp. Castelsardo]|uniref:DEAD/DEAH box helicase n=1 Tax=Oceanobacillus sp. Castelsardo TaxID=1851204 RepID=UPI0008380441|nr:DEAD/DEAH box helicase [Oceanobacillus sp. Castelsardo]
MQLKLHTRKIKERCGTVSFKKGEAFFRNQKVMIEEESENEVKATVKGVEDFHVMIRKENGQINATCSCPTLSSFQKDCQHVAAVFIALQHQDNREEPQTSETEAGISDEIVKLFQDKPIMKSGTQNYFENRITIFPTFFCKVVRGNLNYDMFAIEISIESTKIKDIREFLAKMRSGESYFVSQQFTYNPEKYCFDKDSDMILQHLIRVMDDEKIYQRALPSNPKSNLPKQQILIPVSLWDSLVPLIESLSHVTLEYDQQHFIGIRQSDELLPLVFEFGDEKKGFSLKISGLQKMKLMTKYNTVLYQGRLIRINSLDMERLAELKRMLEFSKTDKIPIPTNQISYYMEKLVPALRKIGEVHLSGSITDQIKKNPLQAKLYIDRLKNRLLVGLEFHYNHVVINPLEKHEKQIGTIIIRDMEKEEEILQLVEEEGQLNQTESGYYLHNEELEYHFLYHVLPKLQRLTQVYATTAVRNRIFRKNWKPKIKVKHRKERTNWLHFTFDMDGIPQSEIKDVLEALEEKRKYYRLKDGTLFSLETKELEEIERFLRQVPLQDDDQLEKGLDVPIVQGLRLLDTVESDETLSYEDSFREFLKRISDPDSNEYNVPDKLEGTLRNYQKQGYRWMKMMASFGFGGILADDMGLGKTVQSIAYILSELPDIRKRKLPVLIVSPSSVTYNWLSELMKFAPELEAIVVDGKKSDRMEIFHKRDQVDVLITSYPLLRSDIRMYERENFHTIFFDEAQMFKNPLTQTARSVKKLQADHRFALTGTPMENALEELWAIFHVVFPELFLGLKEYSKLTKKQIARRIRPFMLRRVKEDVLEELPEKKESVEYSELYPEQKTLYAGYLAKLRHDTFKHLDKDTIRKNRIKILAGITRLRQICCHPVLFVHDYKGSSAKFDQLMEIVAEAKQSGRRVLIFSQFTKMLDLIGKEFVNQEIPYFYLDGHTPSRERVTLCNQFNQGERDFFLISLKAGGTGLNLTGADTVIFYDSWWNPAVEEQAADRAHRMGQKHTVQVLKLIAKGTIEEKMNDLQERKRHLIEEVIDPEDSMLQTLTDDDIRDLLKEVVQKVR